MLRLFARVSVVVAAVALAWPSHAAAQEPALEVFYRKLDPKEGFKYTWKGKEASATAGVFRWEVPASEFGTNGLDRNFTGYCAEVLVPITADKTYRFRKNSIYEPANYGLVDHPNGPLAAVRRGHYIQELFGRYFRDPVGKSSVTTDEAVAFQIALWEIIQETEPAEGEAKRDLFGGDFRANYPKAEAPACVLKAQGYLDSLTGDDTLYYENPDLRGRELIRLMGIENAEKVVAQSQFALRYVGGGAAGDPPGRTLTAGGGGGSGGAPGLGGGTGGGSGGGTGGGGGGLVSGGGGSGNGNPGAAFPTVAPSTTTLVNGGSNISPVNDPTTTTSTPPVGGPNDPATPIPAPAGLLLGAVALGTLGSWRIGSKLLKLK